jgi:hypothetical protein
MANITIKDLSAHSNSESFVKDLSEDELKIQGGAIPLGYLLIIAAIEIGHHLL